MQPQNHTVVQWELISVLSSVALGWAGTAVGTGKVGRLLLWAGAYACVLAACFLFSEATSVNRTARLLIAVLVTALLIVAAWPFAWRFLREDSHKPGTAHRSRDPQTRPSASTDLRIQRVVERDAEQMREIIATGNVPPPDPMREHVRELLDESALDARRPPGIDLERFAEIARDVANRWSNASSTQPVRIIYGTATQISLRRGPVAATFAQNGDRIEVTIGSLDYQTAYKTVSLTENDAKEIGKELGERMRA